MVRNGGYRDAAVRSLSEQERTFSPLVDTTAVGAQLC